jgi:hypothetical protein
MLSNWAKRIVLEHVLKKKVEEKMREKKLSNGEPSKDGINDNSPQLDK